MTAHSHRELTKNQSLVLGALDSANGPLTAYAILDLLREDGFRAPLQVYRALDKLVSFGMVHRLESMNAFVACTHKHCGDQNTAAFAICDVCSQVEEFEPTKALDCLRSWTGANGFMPARTTIELRGTCRKCRAS